MSVFSDYYAKVSAGRIQGHKQYLKTAYNNTLQTGVAQDITNTGGDIDILVGNTTCEVVSTSALDTAGGTGSRSIAVFGIDEDMKLVEEIVQLNGLTPVPLQNQYIAVWRSRNVSAGVTRLNQGSIVVRTVISQTTLSTIDALIGSSASSLMVVPAGYQLVLYDLIISMGVVTGSAVERKAIVTARSLDYFNNAETVQAEIGVRDKYSVTESFKLPLSLSESQFLWFRAEDVSANDTPIQCSYTLELIKT